MRCIAVVALLVAVASAGWSPMETLQNVGTCGSKGEVLEVRVTGCARAPCTLNVFQPYQVEVDFVPSVSHSKLEYKITAIHGSQSVDLVKENMLAALSSGNAYSISSQVTVGGDFTGLVLFRVQLSGNGVTEVCSITTANIRAPIIF